MGEDFFIFFMVLSNRDLATGRYRDEFGSTVFVLNLDGLSASQPATVKENGRSGDAAKGNPRVQELFYSRSIVGIVQISNLNGVVDGVQGDLVNRGSGDGHGSAGIQFCGHQISRGKEPIAGHGLSQLGDRHGGDDGDNAHQHHQFKQGESPVERPFQGVFLQCSHIDYHPLRFDSGVVRFTDLKGLIEWAQMSDLNLCYPGWIPYLVMTVTGWWVAQP